MSSINSMARAAAATALCAALAMSSAIAGSTDDAFDGTALDWCKWEDTSLRGTVAQADELVLTADDTEEFASASALSQYRLIGDFDIQVDYRFGSGFTDPVPPVAGMFPQLNVALGIHWNSTRFIQFSRYKSSSSAGLSVYASSSALAPGQSMPFAEASSSSGKLRLVRTGSRLRFLHAAGSDWMEIGALTVPSTPVAVFVTANHVAIKRAVTAYVDNYRVNSGATDSVAYAQPTGFARRADFALGGVSENWPSFRYFGSAFQSFDPLAKFREQGMEWMRVGVTTVSRPELDATPPGQWKALPWRNDYWGSREYAAATLSDAASRGMRLYAYLYFSDQAANWGNQQAPAAWVGKSVEETAALVEQHAYETATYFKSRGLNVEIYELGNETDIGMIDFLPGRRIVVPEGLDFVNDHDWLRENVWNVQATLLKAGIAGIRRASPTAKIAIHPAGLEVGTGTQFAAAYFRAMRDYGVAYDIAALSNPYAYYPWKLHNYSTTCWFKRVAQIVNQVAAPGKPAMFVEASYQSDPRQLKATPMRDFPFSPDGQAAWLREQLRFASNHPALIGWFWFYPDFYAGRLPESDSTFGLGGGSLLASESQTKPALSEFRVNLAPTSPTDIRPQTGLWAVDDEVNGSPGRGFQVDVRGNTIVLTFYGYDSFGVGKFWLAAGSFINGSFSGQLTAYDGGTAFGGLSRVAHASGDAGLVTLSFSSATQGTITLPNEAPKPISRFDFGSGGSGNEITPQPGLWAVSSEVNGSPGRGFQLDLQANSLVVTFYGYDASGNGRFWLASGEYANNGFEGSLTEYEGGTSFGGPFQPARAVSSVGKLTIKFLSDTAGTITLPGEGTKAISRFAF